MSDLLANPNPWILAIIGGLIVAVGSGLILYHIFRVGKADTKQQKIETGASQSALLASNPVQTSTPAITPNPTPTVIKLTPKEIMDHLDRIPPFQREEAASHYKGTKVSWIVNLASSYRDHKGDVILHVHYKNDLLTSIFCEEIDIEKYPEVKIITKGQEFRVEGEISKIWVGINLINCKLYF